MSEAKRLTEALGGRWFGRYGVARCPAHDDAKPSLSIADGDTGALLLNCKAGCDFRDVLSACRDTGALGGDYTPNHRAGETRRQERKAHDVKLARMAKGIWGGALPIEGTSAETYLRGRGITCPLPDSLRFAPSTFHGPSAKHAPAMVARVEGIEGFAVHRTYLRPDGSGKADLDPCKMMLGGCAGGAVRVCEGRGPLVVAEGIETALSLASGLLSGPATIWAALSTSGIQGLTLPPAPGRLCIAHDGDNPGRIAANKLAERAYREGWQVSLLPAPEGKDWNDVLRMEGAA